MLLSGAPRRVGANPYGGSGGGGGGGLELAGDGTAETAARSDHQHVVPGYNGTNVGVGPDIDFGRSTGTQNKTGVGRGASPSGLSATAVGEGSVASAAESVAIGRSAGADGIQSLAFGPNSRARGDRSIVIGRYIQSTTPDTAVIKANDLDPQRSEGSGETRHALYSPDGTKYWLSVEDDGTLTVTEA